MGMSTHVIGLVSEDNELYQKHKAVLMACYNAGIERLPEETAEFFGYSSPEPCALEEKLQVSLHSCATEYNDDMMDGFEIKVSEIPPEVETIRFYNAY